MLWSKNNAFQLLKGEQEEDDQDLNLIDCIGGAASKPQMATLLLSGRSGTQGLQSN